MFRFPSHPFDFGEPVHAILFFVFWCGCFGWAIRFVCKTFAPTTRAQFSFYITDIWAMMLGLTPSLALISLELNPQYSHEDFDAHVKALFALGILGFSQLLGIFIARLHSIPREGEPVPRRMSQAFWIWAGAFGGIAALLCIALAYWLLALFAGVCLSCPPFGFIAFAWIAMLVFAWRKMTL
jgi:hypothetical protein